MSETSSDNDATAASVGGAPRWVAGAGRARAFLYGVMVAPMVPGLILLASAAGFGVLAHDAGLSLSQSLLVMALYFGLPAQVAVADQLARDASFWSCAFAVALTGVRLLPMTVTLVPYLREPRGEGVGAASGRAGIAQVLAVHFVAVTAWLEGMRTLPQLPGQLRVAHFLGIGTGLLSMTLVGTAAGFLLVGVVPAVVGAVLLFVSPAYFLLSLIDGARVPADWWAIGLGCALSPIMYFLAPGFDLLLAALFGGTVAFFLGRNTGGGGHGNG